MRLSSPCLVFGLVLLRILANAGMDRAFAGAWLMPPGHGQIIAGAAFSDTTRAFDAQGRIIPVPSYRKFELGTYMEYGVSDRLTLVVSPSYVRVHAPPPAQSYNGLGETEIAARFGLYRDFPTVVSMQAGFRTPGASIADSTGPVDVRRAFAVDIRAMIGRACTIATFPSYIDVQLGYRYYAQNQPGEWRLDLTLGTRFAPRLLALFQSFSTFSTAAGGGYVRYSWHKVAASAVYDLSPEWSVQGGGFFTVTGSNAGRELGPFGTIWYRF